MIINSKRYSGPCACGKKHTMTTEFCVVENGCMKNFDTYVNNHGINGLCTAIYDENTYHAFENVRPNADYEIVLPPQNLHADNGAVGMALEKIPENCKYLIAAGSGTVHDITRFCAHKLGIPFISCPSAASVDGFCSSVAAMTWNGFKKTFSATAPKIVVADLDIISKAPFHLTKSGVGDMIGKFIALAEWEIGKLMKNEYFCDEIYKLSGSSAEAVVQSAEKLANGDVNAYENLVGGLLMSGIAMQLLGNSRCASGAEHHISHLIEMQPCGIGKKSDALHGEKVGVGTLIAAREYYGIINEKNVTWHDYAKADDECIKEFFGEILSASILEENKNDVAFGIKADDIAANLAKITEIVAKIPSVETLEKVYNALNMKSTLSDIGINAEKENVIKKYSPLVRNRLTLMRLISGAGIQTRQNG